MWVIGFRDEVVGHETRGVVLVAGSIVGLACSSNNNSASNSNSASQQVCNDRAAFSSSVQTLGNDLQALNLGRGEDDAEALDAFNTLVDSVKALSAEQRQSLSPNIDALQSDVNAFTGASNVSDLSSVVNATRSDANRGRCDQERSELWLRSSVTSDLSRKPESVDVRTGRG